MTTIVSLLVIAMILKKALNFPYTYGALFAAVLKGNTKLFSVLFPEQLDDLGLMGMAKIRTTIIVKMMSTVVFVV